MISSARVSRAHVTQRELVDRVILRAAAQAKELVAPKNWICRATKADNGLSARIEIYQGNMKAETRERPHVKISAAAKVSDVQIYLASQSSGGSQQSVTKVEEVNERLVQGYLLELLEKVVAEGPAPKSQFRKRPTTERLASCAARPCDDRQKLACAGALAAVSLLRRFRCGARARRAAGEIAVQGAIRCGLADRGRRVLRRRTSPICHTKWPGVVRWGTVHLALSGSRLAVRPKRGLTTQTVVLS